MTDRGGIVCVRVLGGVDAVTSNGSTIDLPSASQRRLLGLLALHAPRRLRSEWLADVLGVSPGALRTTVSRLRSAVGPDALLTASTGYSLACEVDASQFCQAVAAATESGQRMRDLDRALTLWTGPVLDEFSGEEWASGETARLTEIHAGAVDDYGDELISARRATDAVALLEGQIARYPYRDRSRGVLIRALALAGRQADALRAFQTYRSLLVDELGTEPSPEVIRIERRVATGWNGLESEPEMRLPSDAVVIPLPAALAHRVAFVGRAVEQDVLHSELELAETTGLRCVLLGGESGMGKTTLVAEFARSVTSSARANVLYGRCDVTGVPLEPFRTLLGSCVEHAPLDLVTEHVARCGGELARICPRVATRVATAPEPTESDDSTERFLAFDAAADLLRRIATRRPLVLVLDDLQWAEPTALLLLRHLAASLADAPVLLLVSRRDPGEHVSDQLRGALADLERGEVRYLQLTGLGEGELAELVVAATRVAPDPELRHVTAWLREETAGNPLYASQLVRHWLELGGPGSGVVTGHGRPTIVMPDGVPPSLREVVWSRVHALGDEVFGVLSAASVLGLEFPQDVLVEMLDLPEPAVLKALDVAMAAGVLIDMRSVRRALRFVHAVVANALYIDVGPSMRARMHERAAHALAKGDEVVAPDVVVQLARHCALAGLVTEALHWSVCAGDHAFEHLAPTEAAHHYQVALDAAVALHRPDAERADLLVRLGDAEHRAGDPHALETLEQGADLARRSGNNQALIRAAFAADRGFMRIDRGAPAYVTIVEAAVVAADPQDTATYSRLLALLAQSLTFTPDAERRVVLAQEALALAEAADEPILLAQMAPAVVSALWAPGSGRKRGEVATRALAGAEASGDPRLQFGAHLSSYTVAVESGDPVMAAHSLAKLRSTARAVGEPRMRWVASLYDTFEATMTARLDDAQGLATATLEFGMQIGVPDVFTFFAGQFFVIGTFAGRHEELFPLVEQATRDNPTVVAFKVAHGIICAATGRDDVARQILREGTATGFAQLPVDNMWMTTVIGYAVLAIELDDVEAAVELLPIIEPFATEVAFNGVTSQGPVAAYVGKLASLLGRHDQAEDQLQAALAMAAAFGWTYHLATTLIALAQARFRRLGALDTQARSWLTEASEMCHAGGFRNWIERIDELEARSPLQVARP